MNETPPLEPWPPELPLDSTQLKGRICNRCSHTLPDGFRATCGIKNPCPNCGYLYPVGDCAD